MKAKTTPRLGTNDLEIMVRSLGQHKKLEFIPTDRWGYDATRRAIFFDRKGLLELHKNEAAGLVYQKIGHAIHSIGTKDPWAVADRAVRVVDRKIAKGVVHPRSAMALFRMLEEERVERLQRQEYQGLVHHALPRRDNGYRAGSHKADLKTLHEGVLDAKQLPRLDPDIQVPPYWIRAGIAMQAIASGIDITLPKDMPWPQDLRDEIRAIGDATTLDDLMTRTAALLPRLVDLRIGSDDAPSGANGQPAGHSKRDQTIEAMRRETEAQSAATQAIEFVRDSTDRLDTDANERLKGGTKAGTTPALRPPWNAPAWSAVRRTAEPIVGAVRKAVRNHFLLNVIGERETRRRRGRFDAPQAMRSISRGRCSCEVYAIDRIIDERRYDIYLLLDVSGSMSVPTRGNIDPTVFGEVTHAQRWMLAGRLAVTLAETFAAYQNVRVGIGVHDCTFNNIKNLDDKLTGLIQDRVMDALQPSGGTTPERAYAAIESMLARSNAQRKLLIHLSDGSFANSVQPYVARFQANNIELVVLTIGMGPQSAIAQGVPATHASEIDDTSLPTVLGTHFRRMIRH